MRSGNGTAPKGVYAASVTAVKADGHLDLEATLCHARWLLAHGCDGVVALSWVGEALSLSTEQRLGVLAVLADALPRDRLMIGTAAAALADAVRLTRAAVAAGCHHVLLHAPYSHPMASEDGLFRYFAAVIEGTGAPHLRLYLDRGPQGDGARLSDALITRLCGHFPEIIRGLKDEALDAETCRVLGLTLPGLHLFGGSEADLPRLLPMGGAGCVSASVNLTAPLARKLTDAWALGQDTTPLVARLTMIREVLAMFPTVAAIKTLLTRRSGHAGWGHVLPPLDGLDGPAQAALLAALPEAGPAPPLPSRAA